MQRHGTNGTTKTNAFHLSTSNFHTCWPLSPGKLQGRCFKIQATEWVGRCWANETWAATADTVPTMLLAALMIHYDTWFEKVKCNYSWTCYRAHLNEKKHHSGHLSLKKVNKFSSKMYFYEAGVTFHQQEQFCWAGTGTSKFTFTLLHWMILNDICEACFLFPFTCYGVNRSALWSWQNEEVGLTWTRDSENPSWR